MRVLNIQAPDERVSQAGFEHRLHEFQPLGRKYDDFQQQQTMHPSVYIRRAVRSFTVGVLVVLAPFIAKSNFSSSLTRNYNQ